jgi:monomeric sarcosine oxidase
MSSQPQIVVIGAGIVGLSTAFALLEQGMRNVLVLEQAVVNHTRATSSSISRLLRFEYGADLLYSRMVKSSLELWQDLEMQSQKKLYTPTGLLAMGKGQDDTLDAYEILRNLGLPNKLVSHQYCNHRFPQFDVRDYSMVTFNAAGGILSASLALHVLKRSILERGGRIAEMCKVTHIAHENIRRPLQITLDSGDIVRADRAVIAIGPWVHRLLHHLNLPIELTRQFILYFAGLAPSNFGVGTFPAFMDGHLYGFPIHKGSKGWLKASTHTFGQPVDPDGTITFDEKVIARTVRDLRRLLPALRGAELAHVEACMYDVTPDEDFILDTMPGDSRIAFATGLSGHGFKFGPLLGRILCNLICETTPDFPLNRFQMRRFSHQSQREATFVA